jgi:hypothetical protein
MVLFECVINGQCKKIQRICNFYNEDKQKKAVLTSANVPIFPVHGLGSYVIKNKKLSYKNNVVEQTLRSCTQSHLAIALLGYEVKNRH